MMPIESITEKFAHGHLHNLVLSVLPEAELALLLRSAHQVHLAAGTILFAEGDEINDVYFPESGLISLCIETQDGQWVETATIGYDGALGLNGGLCTVPAFGRAVLQLPSTLIKIPSSHFVAAATESAHIRDAIGRYHSLLISQIQQTVACNALHSLNERLCRWLLQSHDLCREPTIPLTQEFLAQVLSVRRTTVTRVARMLQASRIISYRRGQIHIVNRAALEHRACECYRIMCERRNMLFTQDNSRFRSGSADLAGFPSNQPGRPR